ncbi:protealysin inhibitor emfourin [Nakamurella sp. A5-74]|uniref:Neutral metalloproteinase n=1 Tax=Nakamurella sp. A5-74 TaxID=3158264 RepID=A0AAU8DN33_9ACTN
MTGFAVSLHPTRCCGIVPPYLLDALSRSPDRTVAGRAARTLLRDERMRRDRVSPGQSVRGAAPAPRAPGRTARTVGPRRSVHDAEHGAQLPGDLVRDEGAPEVADEAVNQAYDGLGDTWRLFHDVFGRNSLDGKGLPLIASVHYERDYDNAFWNGEQMVFGDGDGRIFGPFTASIDVIGHELTHGVTEHTAGLRYQGQSGALNESISDVFGVLVKQYVLGQTADQADWLIGADLLLPSVNGVALRSMAAPGTAYDDPELGKDPQPATMADYVETSSDNGGVHINSGIPNKAFHLVATAIGGNAWEAPGSIWFEVLTGGPISADCDFVEFARLTEQAAVQLYGNGSAQAVAVAAAWQQVGVTDMTTGEAAPSGNTPSADGPSAAPAAVVVTRTGGFAGTSVSRTVDLAGVPAPEVAVWRGLLAADPAVTGARQGAIPTSARLPHPDAFSYEIAAPGSAPAVYQEHQLSPAARDCLLRTFRG